MRKIFVSVVDGVYYLLSGEQREEPAFRQKLRTVLLWCLVIVFCLVMLKLFIGK